LLSHAFDAVLAISAAGSGFSATVLASKLGLTLS
jgi:hypothetical protein